jgi:hypothetical protein
VVDRKEVRFGKIDQMSRAEIENRLKQIMGDVVEGELVGDSSLKSSVVNEVQEDAPQDNEED